MSCNQICQYNAYGAINRCLKPESAFCPMLNSYGEEQRALKAEDTARKAAQEAKADKGKLQIHMVPMQIVRDVAEVRMYGTAKYGGDENNWRRVELIRYVDAMLRHTLAFLEDFHSVDAESGIPHYKHAECNWAFISQLMHDGKCPPKKERETHEGICGTAAVSPGE